MPRAATRNITITLFKEMTRGVVNIWRCGIQAAVVAGADGIPSGRAARPGRPALAARVGAEGGQAAYMFVAPLQELSMDDSCGPEVMLPWA